MMNIKMNKTSMKLGSDYIIVLCYYTTFNILLEQSSKENHKP